MIIFPKYDLIQYVGRVQQVVARATVDREVPDSKQALSAFDYLWWWLLKENTFDKGVVTQFNGQKQYGRVLSISFYCWVDLIIWQFD